MTYRTAHVATQGPIGALFPRPLSRAISYRRAGMARPFLHKSSIVNRKSQAPMAFHNTRSESRSRPPFQSRFGPRVLLSWTLHTLVIGACLFLVSSFLDLFRI